MVEVVHFRHYLVEVVHFRHYLVVVVRLRQVVVRLLQVVVRLRQVVVADLHLQADSQVHKDCLHNLLHFVNQVVVHLLQVDYLLLQEVDCILHLLVVVTGLLGLHFLGTQVHKDYHHNLGLE